MKVRTQTNLVKSGLVWYCRNKVPQDLRSHYGQESIRQSLKQLPAISDARREAARLAVRFDAEFEAIRDSIRPRHALPLTTAMVPQLAK